MRLYNTLTRTEETFAPASANTVRLYTCGPTIYARGHIGNFRTFVRTDAPRRPEASAGHDVRHVMNFTDVDDRTIVGAQKVDVWRLHGPHIVQFREDAPPSLRTSRRTGGERRGESSRDGGAVRAPQATSHLCQRRINLFQDLHDACLRRLAHLDTEGLKDGARIDSDNYGKDDARDFVLWKASKPGEPSWDVVDPPGRPGWHRECSARALRLLGEPPIDIHSGGIDLIFPHHENEIAQSEGATKKPFSRFWVHVEHLLVDDEKMSKSLENTYTIPDIVARGYRASALRYLLLSSHYRKQLNFTWGGLTRRKSRCAG
jgi:cysteinyl-tRNA synthetase